MVRGFFVGYVSARQVKMAATLTVEQEQVSDWLAIDRCFNDVSKPFLVIGYSRHDFGHTDVFTGCYINTRFLSVVYLPLLHVHSLSFRSMSLYLRVSVWRPVRSFESALFLNKIRAEIVGQ